MIDSVLCLKDTQPPPREGEASVRQRVVVSLAKLFLFLAPLLLPGGPTYPVPTEVQYE